SNVRAFFEASYLHRRSNQRLAPEVLFTLDESTPVSAANPHNDLGVELDDVAKRFVTPRRYVQDVHTFRLVTGVDGDVPDAVLEGWRWHLSYGYGRSGGSDVKHGNLARSRIAESLGPDCTGSPSGCVPLDI